MKTRVNHQNRQNLLQRLKRKALRALSDMGHKLAQRKYARSIPPLFVGGGAIVNRLGSEGASVQNLDDLPFSSNEQLKAVMKPVINELNIIASNSAGTGYDSGFNHCIPIPPEQIARTFPELFFWGLDEKLLDLMEHIIGLPVAYHGVVARKEIIDNSAGGSRRWHMDNEDRDITRVLVYLSDVMEDADGPFEYIPRRLSPTYRDFKGENSEHISDERMAQLVPQDQWKRVYGPAGTVIVGAVGNMFHRGHLPQTSRICISFYYTSRKPTNESLTTEFSFKSGIPFVDPAGLSKRQLDSLWKYQKALGTKLKDVEL